MEKRIPSVPLITCDPYFSVWSPADHLYDKDTCHWTGRAKPIKGVIKIDGKTYRFMGAGEEEILLQKKFEITSTTSSYIMEGAGIRPDERVSWRGQPKDLYEIRGNRL